MFTLFPDILAPIVIYLLFSVSNAADSFLFSALVYALHVNINVIVFIDISESVADTTE